MNNVLWETAKKLASRPYSVVYEQDSLPDGESYVIARHPELPGCKADGSTKAEAEENLAEARADYIYALLETGLPIPEALDQLEQK